MEKLHFYHHRLMLDVKQNMAATKIQHFVRALKVRRAFQYFIQQVRLIQKWIRKRFQQENVFDVVERVRRAPIIQRFMRGYLARERIAVSLHKFRMERQLREQEALFSPQRIQIMQSLQITLAYHFRKRKAKKIEAARLAEIARIEKAEQEKR